MGLMISIAFEPEHGSKPWQAKTSERTGLTAQGAEQVLVPSVKRSRFLLARHGTRPRTSHPHNLETD
jgi:hypothetical protein